MHDPTRGGVAVPVAPGDDVAIAGFEIVTIETEITLDVREPEGDPEINIRSPFVSGFGARLDESGNWIGDKRFWARGSSQEQPRPVVRIVGEPGTYSVTVDATVGSSRPRFGSFTLVLEPFDTPAGPGVVVMPAEDVELEFDNVIEPGITTVAEVPLGPEPAAGFKILSPGGTPVYYNFSTTAVFDGFVKVCIDYDDTGITAQKEKNLKLFHFDATLDRWDNITAASTAEEPNPDTLINRLCGHTDSFSTFAIMVPDNVLPEIEALTASLDPVRVGNPASASVTFVDPNEFDDHIAEWDWDDGSKTIESVVQGARVVVAEHVYASAGVYRISVTISDAFGSDSQSVEFIVVYDPDGGFVTGGGFIQSPAGAYPADPTRSGKATFGFVSKYKKGAGIPSGQTQFQFKAGDLNFHSTAYEWLVIAGARAQYKGAGIINNAGDYSFLLTAIDGQQNGGGGTDRFRIKLWDRATGEIVFDNQNGESEDSAPNTELSGGSIVIHSGR